MRARRLRRQVGTSARPAPCSTGAPCQGPAGFFVVERHLPDCRESVSDRRPLRQVPVRGPVGAPALAGVSDPRVRPKAQGSGWQLRRSGVPGGPAATLHLRPPRGIRSSSAQGTTRSSCRQITHRRLGGTIEVPVSTASIHPDPPDPFVQASSAGGPECRFQRRATATWRPVEVETPTRLSPGSASPRGVPDTGRLYARRSRSSRQAQGLFDA